MKELKNNTVISTTIHYFVRFSGRDTILLGSFGVIILPLNHRKRASSVKNLNDFILIQPIYRCASAFVYILTVLNMNLSEYIVHSPTCLLFKDKTTQLQLNKFTELYNILKSLTS